MSATPFIKPIQTDKGILYSFRSAVDDISSTFSDGRKFRFSKFALLRVPEMGAPENPLENKVQFLAPGETSIKEGIDPGDYNRNLAESFQNYALNLEALMLAREDHRESPVKTSEKIFWKWLKETGAVRWREANIINERDGSVISEPRYVEQDEGGDYSRVVKMLGEINAVNSRNGANAHTEVYIYVPSESGSTPRVMFTSSEDENYKQGMRVQNLVNDPLDVDYLAGRSSLDAHPFGLNTKAYYDLDDSSVLVEMSEDLEMPDYEEGSWFDYNTLNSYYTDPVFGDASDYLIRKTLGSVSVEYVRNSLDGVAIDWDLDNYKLANDIGGVNTFAQFSELAGNESRDFEFNAVLIYYDVVDQATGSNSTNLFGVLFVNEAKDQGAALDFFIPAVPKRRPDPLQKTNGNALGYKLNVKLDSTADESAVDRSVNEYNNFGMDLYMDALTQMTRLADNYASNLGYVTKVKNEVDEMKTLLLTDVNKNQVLEKVSDLEASLAAAGMLVDEENAFSRFISDLYQKYDDILNDKTTVSVSTVLDRTELNNMVTLNQSYNLSASSYKRDFSLNSTLKLLSYANYYRHESTDELNLGRDLTVRISDDEVKWKDGQSFKINFSTPVNPGIYKVRVLTDSSGEVSGSSYGKEVAVFDSAWFSGSDGVPVFEIICVDAQQLFFDVIKIK